MGTIRIISPNGTTSDVGYEKKEPPIELLQRAVGGYVEHIAVEYEGKRRSAYINEEARLKIPKVRQLSGGVVSVLDNRPNKWASAIAHTAILGPMAIDMGKG